MIAYTFLLLLTLVVAYLEARDDANTIRKQDDVDHKAEVKERIVALGVPLVVIALAASVKDWTWHWEWRTLLFIPICWAVFTVGFRWMLNKMRGKHWCYVAPWSNNYDRFFWAALSFLRDLPRAIKRKKVKELFRLVCDQGQAKLALYHYVGYSEPEDLATIHRAGL